MKKKLVDAEAWLAQCNKSWMNYNLAQKIIREAPIYEVDEALLESAGAAAAAPAVSEIPAAAPKACRCRSCGAEIVWVTMQSGRKMPCDAALIYATEDKEAKTSFVLPSGMIKRGTEGRRPNGTADFAGYRSHFETCPQADEFRRGQK